MLVNGEFTILEVPGASDTSAYGINNDGHIVGSHQFGDSQVHGFLLVDGQYTTIDHPGALYTLAFGINDTGVIVGWYTGSTQHGFVWINGTFTTVDVPNGTQSAVHGINGGGSLVGSYVDLDPRLSHGFLATPEPGDTSPPTITVSASPTTLSPPNGRLVIVTVSGTITDEPDGSGVQTSTYQVIDEYGQVQPRGSVIPGANGRYTFTVALQASRRGNDPDGRHYTITVSASDMAGNVDDASATVTVPRN